MGHGWILQVGARTQAAHLGLAGASPCSLSGPKTTQIAHIHQQGNPQILAGF